MISIIHPSARPEKAWETACKWWYAAYSGEDMEHIFCFDWPEQWSPPCGWSEYSKIRRVHNLARKCSVDATNCAASHATPRADGWLVVISDDVTPMTFWDDELRRVTDGDFAPRVIAVDTMDQEDPTHTLTVQILNRVRYEQLGYIFHPDYTSMYADDEFTRHAKKDGVLHEALHIKMKHERFERDEVYERQQGAARFAWGEALLRHREKHGFPRVTPGLASMREVVNIWNLGEGRITGEVEKAIAALEGR